MTLHPIKHSIGLAITDRDPGHVELSFTVGVDGHVEELAGWGFAGPPIDTGHFVNAPPNPLAVHTVRVDGDNADVLAGLRSLVVEHNERYSGGQVWLSTGVSRELRAWVAAGCPDPAEAPVPTDEELAAANVTEVPTADDSFYGTSEPRADEVSYAALEEEAEADKAAKVAKAREDHRKRQLRAQLDEAGVRYDGRWGADRLEKELAEAKAAAETDVEGDGTSPSTEEAPAEG